MALINKWPQNAESFYDNKQWEAKTWAIGEPITKEKLQKMDDGIAILATQIKAILGEFNPSSLDGAQLNASRLDKVQEWITGSSSTTYSGTNIVSRLSNIDTLNTNQNNRLNSIESINTTQSTDISSLKTRATNLENRATAIETLNTTQNERLDSIESKNTEQDGRLGNIETLNTQQNNKLAAIISEIGGTGNDGSNTTYGGTSRIDSLATEVWGSNTTSGTSRISKNDNKIAALVNELGGGTPDGTSTTYPTAATRLDDLEKEIGGTRSTGKGYTNSRIDTLESTSNTHTNELTAIKSELGGTISGSTYDGTTRLDSVITKTNSIATNVWGTDTTSGNSRIDKLTAKLYGSTNITDYDSTSRLDSAITKLSQVTTELYGSDSTSVTSRLDDLEKEVGGTRTSNGTGYTNSRIDNIETHDASVDKAIAAIKNEIGGAYVENSGFTNSRIDTIITEIYGSNDTSITSRLYDLEKEICGDTITRTSGTGYDNSRIDSLEDKVGDGAIDPYNNISDAIRKISKKVGELDPTGQIGLLDNIMAEIWEEEEDGSIDITKDSYIDILKAETATLENRTTKLGTDVNTLASEKEELKQKLNETNTKIPIEMYVATNTSASDTIELDTTPRDKSIFFIAVKQGTLGTNNLTLQTPDIQFNNILINRFYNGNGMKIKYPAGSLISIYRNGANAYVYNMPMVL